MRWACCCSREVEVATGILLFLSRGVLLLSLLVTEEEEEGAANNKINSNNNNNNKNSNEKCVFHSLATLTHLVVSLLVVFLLTGRVLPCFLVHRHNDSPTSVLLSPLEAPFQCLHNSPKKPSRVFKMKPPCFSPLVIVVLVLPSRGFVCVFLSSLSELYSLSHTHTHIE